MLLPVRILGIEIHLPQHIETLGDMGRENPDWRIDKIFSKSGIKSRHVAAPGETASDLGLEAARKLLARQLVDPAQIDFLLYCTQSPDHFLPSTACQLQHRLGLGKRLGAFDFNLGCSGYVYGLAMAKSFITSGLARNVLLITADTYTRYIHPRDRTVRTLFGDGAAATLIGPCPDGQEGIGQFVLGTDGAGFNDLLVPAGGLRMPRSHHTATESMDKNGCTRSSENLYMDGKAVFTFSVTEVPETIAQLYTRTGLKPEQIDWFVYHQASRIILNHLAQRSNVPEEKMVLAFEDIGNTVSASIPIAIYRYSQAGKITPGQRLMLVGFGVGYSWGACTVVW
jgi:3-oxoacyl-[acyl-carrier-protein] synthase-3